MKKSLQNILIFSFVILCFYIISKIQLLIIYFFIALVLSITINPVSNLLCTLKIGKFKINETFSTIICLCIISTICSFFGLIFSPIIIEEINIIKSIKIEEMQKFASVVTNQINQNLSTLNIEFETKFTDLFSFLNFGSISNIFQSMLGLLGNIFMAFFSIIFISFFLIKDKHILKNNAIKLMSYFTNESLEKVNTIIYFIRRYFIGLCIQTTILFILFSFGMHILKLPNPWTLALFAAVINIIPYFGPLIGFIFTTTIIGTFYLDQNMIELIIPLITKSFVLFFVVQSFDNFIIQPTIYSKAFDAHPLEIFFVAMTAGFIGGIMWMILAMPIYTILKIIFTKLTIQIK